MNEKFNIGSVSEVPSVPGNPYCGGQWYVEGCYSRQEQIAAVHHQQKMERDILKSHLRQEEQQNRRLQKVQNLAVTECSKGIILYAKNASGKIMRQQKLFDCQVTDMICYVREGTDALEWQIEIRHGDSKIQSGLYPVDVLKSVSKLKGTLIGKYDRAVSSADKRIGWDWMRQKLMGLFEKASHIKVPFLPGWFQHGKNWHFWVHSEEAALLESEIISQFTANNFSDLTAEEILEDFSCLYNMTGEVANVSILLLFRLMALLARLVSDSLPAMGLVLVGSNAVDVARLCLRTMDSGSANYEIVNLDADSMAYIEKCVCRLRDTPLIVVSSNLVSRSAHNRLEKIRGWLESSYIEGKQNTMPFIFCLREYSPKYLPDESVVVYTDDLQIPDNLIKAFDKLQSFIISKIESGGTFWVEELKNEYEKESSQLQEGEAESVLTVGRAISSVVIKMLGSDCDKRKCLQMMFYQALKKIEKQLLVEQDILVERFQNGICKMFESCELSAVLVHAESCGFKRKIVYYDEECYFFSKEVLQFIGQKLNFDGKSLLLIRQELADRGFIKQYRATGKRHSELKVDIFVGDSKERKKVFAVKRTFWDSIGGISLYERGEE